MKRNDFLEIKKLDKLALVDKAKLLRGELSEFVMDKNMNKLKNSSSIRNKKRDLAQVLTVLRQKEILEAYEALTKTVEEEEENKGESKK